MGKHISPVNICNAASQNSTNKALMLLKPTAFPSDSNAHPNNPAAKQKIAANNTQLALMNVPSSSSASIMPLNLDLPIQDAVFLDSNRTLIISSGPDFSGSQNLLEQISQQNSSS